MEKSKPREFSHSPEKVQGFLQTFFIHASGILFAKTFAFADHIPYNLTRPRESFLEVLKSARLKIEMNLPKYFRDAISELHRVSWPTRQQAIRISIIVLAVTFVIALVLGFLDTFFSWGYQQLLRLSM